SDTGYSPYGPTTSPSPGAYGPGSVSSHGIAPSPGSSTSYLAPSPAYVNPHSVGPSPGGAYGYSPMTPDVSGPMSNLNPQTPGAGMTSSGGGGSGGSGVDASGYAHDWQTPEIEVRIKAIHDDEDLI